MWGQSMGGPGLRGTSPREGRERGAELSGGGVARVPAQLLQGGGALGGLRKHPKLWCHRRDGREDQRGAQAGGGWAPGWRLSGGARAPLFHCLTLSWAPCPQCGVPTTVSPGRLTHAPTPGPVIVTLFGKSLGRLSKGSQDEVILFGVSPTSNGTSYIQSPTLYISQGERRRREGPREREAEAGGVQPPAKDRQEPPNTSTRRFRKIIPLSLGRKHWPHLDFGLLASGSMGEDSPTIPSRPPGSHLLLRQLWEGVVPGQQGPLPGHDQ